MKRKIALLLMGIALLMLAGCAKNEGSTAPKETSTTQTETPVAQEQTSTQSAEEKEDSPATWHQTYPGYKFDIDFREYPSVEAGDGYIETEDEIGLGIAFFNKYSVLTYGELVTAGDPITDAPEKMTEPYLDLLGGASYFTGEKWAKTSGYPDQALTIDSVEDAGEINGYQTCRFTGTYSFNLIADDSYHSFPVVGYTANLHQSGYPIYVLAVDMSNDHSHANEIDAVALTSFQTLREPNQ